MNKKIIQILFFSAVTALLAFGFAVSFTRDKEQVKYPIYEIKEETLNLQKVPKTVDQTLENVSFAVPIYMYHWVVEDTAGYPYPENMVRPSTLEEQVQYISENGYETIFITELDSITKYENPVALTFDDGFESVYWSAFDILKKYNAKATVFVITDFVDTPGYCTKEQLLEMKESGLIDLQAHTVTHPHLAELSRNEMYSEMDNCNKYLKEQLGVDSTVICYPYGSYNNTTIEVAKELGYKYGLAMDGGVYYSSVDDDYEISRIYATRSMNISTFVSYLQKSYTNVDWE